MKRREFIKLAAISTIPHTIPIPINFDDNETRFVKHLMKNYPVEEAIELAKRYVHATGDARDRSKDLHRKQPEFVKWVKEHTTRDEIRKWKAALNEADHNRLDREFEQLASKFNLRR